MHARPIAGVGIGLRREHYAELLACERQLDFLEITPENYVGHGGWPRQVLRSCAERWPIATHGVSMSPGGPDPLEPGAIASLRALMDEVGSHTYSDHLCYASIAGTAFYDLLPLPWCTAAAKHTAARVRELQDRLQRPLALENISYYAVMPGSVDDEGAFVREVIERAGCGLLLDVANVFVNASNFGRDPFELLHALPLEHAVQVHLAGSVLEDGRRIDNHGAPVHDTVWRMYEAVIARCGALPTLVEWDNAIPPLARVLDEADRARAIQGRITAAAEVA